jgi:hypothetical protein
VAADAPAIQVLNLFRVRQKRTGLWQLGGRNPASGIRKEDWPTHQIKLPKFRDIKPSYMTRWGMPVFCPWFHSLVRCASKVE